MKVQKFIILIIFLFVVAGCRREEPVEEEYSRAIPEEFNFASGSLGYPVLLNGVGIDAEAAGILNVQDQTNSDYVHVILRLTVTNESESVVVPPGMTLVDDHHNNYASWQEPLPYENEINRIPLGVDSGEKATGHLIYIVPAAATQDNLRLRWESELHQSLIDVFLGDLGQPATP